MSVITKKILKWTNSLTRTKMTKLDMDNFMRKVEEEPIEDKMT